MTTRRTSGRARPAKRYTNDAFEGLEIDDEAADSDMFAHEDDSGGDDDFDEAAAADDGPDVEDDVSEGAASGDDDGGYGEDMLSDDEVIGPENDRPARKPKRRGGRPVKPGFMQRAEASSFKTGSFCLLASRVHEHKESEVKVSSRGVPEMYHNTGKDTRILNLFGPAKEDVVPATTARDRWHDEPVLPSRRMNKHGEGGMAFSPLYTKAVRELEASKGWEWYHERGGEQAFRARQEVRVISEDEAAVYLPQTGKPDQPVLLGPFRNQKLFHVAGGKAINIGQAWSKDAGVEAGNSTKGAPVRQAWLFNLGYKVQCLEWVPWREGSQYISAAALQRSKSYRTTENYAAPGFAPTDPTPASIHIWRIQSTDDGRLDYDVDPKLDIVLCTDWGSVRSMRWCPMPRRKEEDENEVHLGLLAGVWADGRMRILDVRYPKSSGTQHVRIETAAIDSKPPDSIYTSVTWMSSSHLACGCANGSFAVFDISDSLLSSEPSGPHGPRPILYQNLHSSYVLSIAAAYPSNPHCIATSSMDGFLRLVDIRAPNQDTVFSQRSRTGSAPLAWHDISQSFLTCDENYTLLALSLRRFHVNMSVGRANSNIQHIAASPFHPFTIMGCADGMVITTNPMRKVLIAKAEMWHQTWFLHEWRRAMGQEGIIDEASASADSRSDLKKPPDNVVKATPKGEVKHAEPMCRVVDGFKAEVYKLWVEQGLPNQYEGVVYNTVYEEESASTQVAWNPNMRCGGWAAAGMGTGLIRVEDLAL
ncbi:transcription factor tfiiic complex subunit tfc6 [Diplodia corticola]|uniref:Transcription factor tfiiic complex subunit tfc6 n=1 Tax=Diplodia corticola TaxID=236234 RepID=A0A1J9RJI7_9PEZI|nr:transcription factor tfiiic complex subunit tfc6 [Diplodia corticola]OJD40633.1 transcription factor tfiiic complex subunit tfc6 [Diplodia corticola]